MKIKILFGTILLASLNQAEATSYPDMKTVDSTYTYEKGRNSITLPILNFKSKRYSTELSFSSFKRQTNGGYNGAVTLSPLESITIQMRLLWTKDLIPLLQRN